MTPSTTPLYVGEMSSLFKGVTDGAQTLLGTKEQTQAEKLQEEMCALCPKLSYTQVSAPRFSQVSARNHRPHIRRAPPPSQRFWGFGICCGIGFLLSMGVRVSSAGFVARVCSDHASAQSLLRFSQLVAGNPTPFALTYSLGNIVSMSGCGMRG